MHHEEKAAMEDASLYTHKDTSVTITNVHGGTGEGWSITVAPDGSATATDHYWSEKEHEVVARNVKYETLWEALLHVAR